MLNMTRTINVGRNAYWNGVGIPPTFDFSQARRCFTSACLKIGIPTGQYALIRHDNEIALLSPLRDVHPHWARWFWITPVRNIIRRPPIYSKDLPIIVDGQKLDRPSIHHDRSEERR